MCFVDSEAEEDDLLHLSMKVDMTKVPDLECGSKGPKSIDVRLFAAPATTFNLST